MLAILAVTFPFFALVLCGYLAVRRHLLPQLAIPGLNSFVLYFALPCMLYRFGASTPIAQLLDRGVLLVYLLCALCTVGVTLALTRRGSDWNNAAFGALVAAFPNTGFMGVPLLLALVGPRSSAPIMVTLVVDLLVTTSLCIALSRLDVAGLGAQAATGRLQNSLSALRHALAGILSNPMPWSILQGALASATGLVLPAPLQETVGLLSDAASPVALFTIGAVLARSQMNAGARTPAMQFVPVALIKLVVHPLLMLGIGEAAIAAGAPLSRSALNVLVLVACLPSASNVALLTERFGADSGRVARIILVSTALAFITFSAAVALVL
jgi:predicted permease